MTTFNFDTVNDENKPTAMLRSYTFLIEEFMP